MKRHYLTRSVWKQGNHNPSDVQRTCDCYTQYVHIFHEDPQEIYRCSICGKPILDKLKLSPAVELQYTFYVSSLERGERTWDYRPLK